MSILVLAYAVVGFIAGTLTWRATAHTWDDGPLWPHVWRAVTLTVTIGVFWPGAVVLAIGLRYPTTRRLITQFVEGKPK